MLGSTSFDGFSPSVPWRDLLGDVRANPQHPLLWLIDLMTTLVNVCGLIMFIALVIVTYVLAVEGARRLVRAPRSLVPNFVLPLVPIVFAYLLAHYFTQFVIQG